MNIEQLPSNILAKLFAYICDRKILREVSKNFKSIIDKHPKLMQKYVLNVEKMKNKDKIQSLYQNLKFEIINFNVFKLVDLFTKEQKSKVQEIYVKRDKDIEEAIWFLQYTIATFNNLKTLFLDINMKSVRYGLLAGIRFKLLPNELSKLESLAIRSEIELTSAMFMFSDIKTIKKLTLYNDDEGNEFPKDAAWKLEELNMDIPSFDDEFGSSCKKFLESQKSTLKVLRYNCSEELCNFIMHNLPDLNLLHININVYRNFCDELKANEKLKSLSLFNFPEDHESLEKILRHYKNIQYLNIRPDGPLGYEEFYEGKLEPKNVELLSLTHLSFHGFVGSFLNEVKMPNLKCLEIDSSSIDKENYFVELALNAENFANVEKLSINGLSMKNVTAIIKKCPKLQHLNLDSIKNYDSSRDESDSDDDCCGEHRTGLKKLFKKVPELKFVGSLGNSQWQGTVEKAFAKLNRKPTIKIYDYFDDMMTDNWPADMIGDFYCFSSNFFEY